MPPPARTLLLILAAALAPAATPPAPRDIFGFAPGDDYKLADYAQITRYYQAVAAAAPDRMRLVEIGKSALGKPIWLAVISSPENLRDLDKHRRISRTLSLGLAATDAEATQLAAEGRVVVWIDSGLHASEVAHAQHSPELTHRLVTGSGAEFDRIRRSVILLQIPVINPDGLDWIAHWYRKNVGAPYERAPLPWLYQKYAGHDNNRDWFAMNLAETRAATRVLYHEWFPQIVYNQHQAPPFPARIFVPPYAEPLNPHIPAPVMEGIHLIGSAMAERFAREGKPGVLSYKTYDAWWNGGLRTAPAFHNMHGILTETALFSYATPHTYELTEIPERFADGLSARDPSIFYQRPFLGGRWGLREPIEYMLTADMAVLNLAADRAQDFLLKSHQLARASIEAGRRGNPYAYVLAAEQWDRPASLLFLEKLLLGGVQVQRARSSFTAAGKTYAAGTYVLLAGQPFRPYLMDLVEPQKYPDNKRPYDIAGWTLSLQMGVRLDRVNDTFTADLEPVDRFDLAGAVSGTGTVLLLDHRQNAVFPAMTELLDAGATIRWSASNGAVVVTGGSPGLATRHGADVTRASAAPAGPAWRMRKPRVALYQPWVANMDQGWTEWLFDTFRVPYTLIHNEDFRKGDLRARFDTIFMASQAAASILHGFRVGEMGAEREGRGRPAEGANQRPEYAGGIGLAGLHQIEQFVRSGGTLVALETATELPVSYFPLSVANRARTAGFSCPGSLLRITVDPAQPLAYGMPSEAIAFSSGGAAFEPTVAAPFNQGDREIRSVARFASKDLLASGWVSGERAVLGKDAVLEARHGQGKVVLIAIRAQFRGQPHGTFKFLLNAAWLGSAEPPGTGSNSLR